MLITNFQPGQLKTLKNVVCIFSWFVFSELSTLVLAKAASSCPSLVSRKDWGANAPKQTTDLKLPVSYVVIHHTAWDRCFTDASCEAEVRKIQDFHQNNRSWWDLGYNLLVGDNGKAYEGRGWRKQGAHARGFNSMSIGITIMGDFREQLPEQKTLDTVRNLIKCGLEMGVINSTFSIVGHLQTARPGYTVCPGKQLLCEISKWEHWKNYQFNGTFVRPDCPVVAPQSGTSHVTAEWISLIFCILTVFFSALRH